MDTKEIKRCVDTIRDISWKHGLYISEEKLYILFAKEFARREKERRLRAQQDARLVEVRDLEYMLDVLERVYNYTTHNDENAPSAIRAIVEKYS